VGNWINSIATMRFRKLFATGSSDGYLRIWTITNRNQIAPASQLEIHGYINHIQFSPDDNLLAIQVSQEQRLGRWLMPIQEARQGVYIIHIKETVSIDV
jgi:WD40 repeat protein